MTDRAAPKSKKPAKDKPAKVAGPKLVDKDIKPGIGHNSAPLTGEKNPEAVKIVDEIIALEAQKKSIAKAVGTLRNRLRTEFSILASSVSREIALRKLDPDVRVQVETNHEDFKKMLGYQPSLDFAGSKPTDASLKAQPTEAKLAERNTEPTRAAPPDRAKPAGFSVSDDDGDDEDSIENREDSGVITREG